MAWKLADLFVQITGNSAQLSSTLTAVKGQLLGLTAMSTNVFAGMGAGFAGMGGLGVGLGLASATVMGLREAARASGDLHESISKTEQTFGTASKQILQAANEMAAKFGIVKKEFIDAASGFGLMLEGAGIGREEAAKMSVTLAKLAADATSFFDVSMSEAITRIASGLAGETESLRRWGPNLTESAIKQKALSMGLLKTNKELDDGTKLLVRYKAIIEGLNPAVGDLALTHESYNNQLRQFNGNLENMKAEVGDAVLPAATESIGALNEMIILLKGVGKAAYDLGEFPMLEQMAQGWNNMVWILHKVRMAIVGVTEEEAKSDKARLEAVNKRLDAQQKGAAGAGAAAALATGDDNRKLFQGDALAYVRHIQEGALGKDKDAIAKQQLSVLNQILATAQTGFGTLAAKPGIAIGVAGP